MEDYRYQNTALNDSPKGKKKDDPWNAERILWSQDGSKIFRHDGLVHILKSMVNSVPNSRLQKTFVGEYRVFKFEKIVTGIERSASVWSF